MGIHAEWRRVASAEALQRSSHTIDVVNGHAYVFGGELQPRQPRDSNVLKIGLQGVRTRTVDVEDITTTSTSPPPRVGSASAVINGKIHVFSGRGGQAMTPIEELGSLWVFDPAQIKWSHLSPRDPSAPFPPPRSYHCAASDGVEMLYVHAGCPASGRLSDLWSFNIINRSWRQLADAPSPPRGGTSIAFADNRLYRMNGFDGKEEQGAILDVYNPERNAWDSISFTANGVDGPGPRSVSALLPVTVDDKSWLVTWFGEGNPSSLGHAGAGKMFDDVWAFDLAQQKWTKVDAQDDHGETPSARGWFDASVVDQSTIILSGGLAENNERLQDCWLLSFSMEQGK